MLRFGPKLALTGLQAPTLTAPFAKVVDQVVTDPWLRKFLDLECFVLRYGLSSKPYADEPLLKVGKVPNLTTSHQNEAANPTSLCMVNPAADSHSIEVCLAVEHSCYISVFHAALCA